MLVAVFAEVGLRLAHYRHGRLSLRNFTQYDPLLGWRISPNAYWKVETEDYSNTLQYGPKALRGKDVPYAKPAGVSRIEILGDSMVDGFSVSLEDRVSEVLEKRLGAGTEVVNLGVSGYSTDQEMLMLETEGWKYHPDLVVLFLYYNDIWMNGQHLLARATFKPVFNLDPSGNLALKYVPVPKPSPALEDRFAVYKVIRDAVKSSSSLYKVATLGHGWPVSEYPMPAGAGGTADQFRVYQKEDKPELKRVWGITQALLKRMNRETQEHGGKFLLFYAPSRVELSEEEWNSSKIPATYGADVVLQHLRQICNAEGIALLDPTQRFRDARKNGPLSYAHDVHWTPAGHRVAADALVEYVQNTQFGRNEAQMRAQSTGVER
jgi:lysophospholipase L1-like esterase